MASETPISSFESWDSLSAAQAFWRSGSVRGRQIATRRSGRSRCSLLIQSQSSTETHFEDTGSASSSCLSPLLASTASRPKADVARFYSPRLVRSARSRRFLLMPYWSSPLARPPLRSSLAPAHGGALPSSQRSEQAQPLRCYPTSRFFAKHANGQCSSRHPPTISRSFPSTRTLLAKYISSAPGPLPSALF